MASQLKVDTITGVTTAGSITIQGEGSATTNLQQGICKAWYDVDGSGTAAINDSLNGSSLTDHGTGDFTITRTNPMNNLTYANGAMSDFDSGDSRVVTVTSNQGSAARTTTAMRHALQDCQANGHDPDHFSVLIFGDLA